MPVNQQLSNEELGRNEYVESFAKGIEVLRALGSSENPLSLVQLAETTGLSRATARRYALTLVHLRVAEQIEHGFTLVPDAIGQLRSLDHEMLALQDAFVLHATKMIDKFREASSFGMRKGYEVEIMRYVKANRLMSMQLKQGDRLPLLGSAQGRALVSQMPQDKIEEIVSGHKNANYIMDKIYETQEQGYAFLDGEMEEGIRSIALPVRSPKTKQTVAAISLCAHSNRMPADKLLSEGLSTLQITLKNITNDVYVTS